jgi:TonB family protein
VAAPKPEAAPARLASKIDTPKKPTRDKPSKPEAPEEKKPATAPTAAPGAAPPTAGPSFPGGTGPGTGPGGGGGSGIVSMNMGDAQFAWYRDAVVALLTSRWSRPVIEGASGTLSVIVTFDVLRDGRVENIRIDSSSGVASLDRSAIRAVEESAPLPPLPPQWDQPMFGARFEFRWTPGED